MTITVIYDSNYATFENSFNTVLFRNWIFDWNSAILEAISVLGNFTPNIKRHSSITDMLLVRNNFIKKRFTIKSKDLMSVLVSCMTSVPYNRIGKHLHVTILMTTSSEAVLPMRPNMAFKDL